MGKTRLAMAVAQELRQEFTDGVWFIDFAPLSDETMVLPAVARALNVRDVPGVALKESIINFLRDKVLLLVLDNCEHLIKPACSSVELLLPVAPQLRVLATSRQALRVAGEYLCQISPLPVPQSREQDSVLALLQYSGVQLFVDRACAAFAPFSLTHENADAVTQICQRLEGIPLALELAAARLNLLDADALAGRLDDAFRLLIHGQSNALPHHQTLRAALDWSYDTLSARERILFQRLAVFAGGFTLEAVESVCADTEMQGASDEIGKAEILDLLSNLIDKSLVAVAGDVKPRARLLEPIREYAFEKLHAAGETDRASERHLRYLIAISRQAAPFAVMSEHPTVLAVAAEQNNIRAVLEWSMTSSGNAGLGLELAGLIALAWVFQGHGKEARVWLERLFEREVNTASPAVCAQAFFGLGATALYGGDPATAIAALEQSADTSRRSGCQAELAQALLGIGMHGLTMSQFAQARPAFEEALELFRNLRNLPYAASTEAGLGKTLYHLGERTLGISYIEAALTLGKGLGAQYIVSDAAFFLAIISLQERDFASCRLHLQEAIVADVAALLPYPIEGFGHLALAERKIKRAARLFGAADHLCELSATALVPIEQWAFNADVSTTRELLGKDVFSVAWAEGRAMSKPEAIAYALMDD